MNYTSRLPCATRPKPDELLSSWVMRLAHDHLLKAHSFGKMLFPGVHVWNTDLDRSATESMLRTLSERTGTALPVVQQTVLRRYEGQIHMSSSLGSIANSILPLGIYHRTRRYYGLLFCPGCLRKDGAVPYFRTHWRLAIMHVCTKCGIYLQDRCPECYQPVAFFRSELGHKSKLADKSISHCFHCGLDLSRVPVERAAPLVIEYQAELERVMHEGWNEQVFHPHLYFVVLRQLAKQLINARPASVALQRAVDTETGWSPIEKNALIRKNKTPIELLPLRVRGGVIQQAQWLLTDWPHRFIEVTRRYRVTSTPFLYAMPNAPFWYYRVVLENLYVDNGQATRDYFLRQSQIITAIM